MSEYINIPTLTLVSKKLNSYLQKIQWCFTFQIYFDMNAWIQLSSHAVKKKYYNDKER